MFRVSRFLCQILFVVAATIGGSQDETTQINAKLIKRVTENRVVPEQFFVGKEVFCQTYIESELRPRELYIESRFSQRERNIWRCEVEHHDVKQVIVQNGSFVFNAEKNVSDNGFQYERLGYDSIVKKSIRESFLTRNHLLYTPTHVFSVDLVEFLAVPTLKIENIVPYESVTGQMGQVVSWSLSSCPPEFPKDAFGEIEWLPNEGFLIEKCNYSQGNRSDIKATADFSFQTEFRKEGNALIPVATVRKEGSVVFTTELISLKACNADPNFYEAESLGLATPSNRKLRRAVVWFSLCIASVFLAWLAFFKFGKRSGTK